MLEDDVLFERVRRIFRGGIPTLKGVGGIHWSYEQTEPLVNASIVLRQFTRLYLESALDDTTLLGWANQIGSETVANLNYRAVELAHSLYCAAQYFDSHAARLVAFSAW